MMKNLSSPSKMCFHIAHPSASIGSIPGVAREHMTSLRILYHMNELCLYSYGLDRPQVG